MEELKRQSWQTDDVLGSSDLFPDDEDALVELDPLWDRHQVSGGGDLVSSRVDVEGWPELDAHMPILDIDDVPVRLVPSSTNGHFHLYIDKVMSWDDFVELMEVMAKVGIVDPGFVSASKWRGQAFVRREGVHKLRLQDGGLSVSEILKIGFARAQARAEAENDPF